MSSEYGWFSGDSPRSARSVVSAERVASHRARSATRQLRSLTIAGASIPRCASNDTELLRRMGQ